MACRPRTRTVQTMQPWLNYHHLLYFWTVVREGGVTAASRKLRLAQPTVSGQLKVLEEALGERLFHRQRGKLILTDTGAHVYRYADAIFQLGRELQDTLAGQPSTRATRLVVGVADEVPKLIVQSVVQPALEEGVSLVCFEDRQDRLLADLATHAVDVVIAEAPVAPGAPVRAHSHLLGESGIELFAEAKLAKRLRKGFPRSLDGAPFLVPIENTIMRRILTDWFEARSVRPVIRAEFQDSALIGAFGRAGLGVFAAPAVMSAQVRLQYGVELVGHLDDVRQRYYAITVERRIIHPAVQAITESARSTLFAQ
jgi:LysR family transcriptional activator of nhaA